MAAAAVMAPVAPTESTYPISIEQAMSDDYVESPDTFEASNLLVLQMSTVLRNMGYDIDTIKKVAGRAEANVIDAIVVPANKLFNDRDSITDFVQTELLSKDKLRQKNIYLNSNEPVLLLEASRELEFEPTQMHSLKEDLLAVLRGNGVKPVRVYARLVEATEQPHIGLTLLNVVNTDIGGPSMVQLLDAAFHGEGWKEELVLKEAWNGYDLLWRDEAWSRTETGAPQMPDNLPANEVQEPSSSTTSTEASSDITQQQEASPVQRTSSYYKDINAVPEDEEDFEPAVVEHSAMKELREREATRSGVQHPTWSRMQDDPGLLDIITTHSSSIKDTDPVSVITAPSVEAPEDEFEVVEKV